MERTQHIPSPCWRQVGCLPLCERPGGRLQRRVERPGRVSDKPLSERGAKHPCPENLPLEYGVIPRMSGFLEGERYRTGRFSMVAGSDLAGRLPGAVDTRRQLHGRHLPARNGTAQQQRLRHERPNLLRTDRCGGENRSHRQYRGSDTIGRHMDRGFRRPDRPRVEMDGRNAESL